jgi:ribosomal protein S18 acetylase RimI-like enzyme
VTGAPGGPEGIEVRRAAATDADAVADVYLASFHATYAFGLAHTNEEVRGWLAGIVAGSTTRSETFVAESNVMIVGMMVLDDAGIDQLYVLPTWQGRGIGSRLVDIAKSERPTGLALYTFQINNRARRFYERHGFVATWFGDGSTNEERQPDVRYEWRP